MARPNSSGGRPRQSGGWRERLAKLNRLLAGYRRFGAGLFLLMFAGAAAESLGLSLVLPLLAVLIGVDTGSGAIAEAGRSLLALFPDDARVEGLLLALAVAFLVKGVLLVAVKGASVIYAMRLRERWARRALRHYLLMPYGALRQQRTGALVQNVVNESELAGMAMTHLLELLNRAVLATLLLGLLLLADWRVTLLIAAVGGGLLLAVRRITFRWSVRYGRQRLQAAQAIAGTAAEAVGQVRQVKLFGAYARMLEELGRGLRRHATATLMVRVLAEAPRQSTEFLIVVLLGGVLLGAKHIAGLELTAAVAFLGFFAVVAQRLLTSVNDILARRVQIAANLPSLLLMHDLTAADAALEAVDAGAEMPPLRRAIELRGVRFAHPGKPPVFRQLDLVIDKGRTTALVGPSGIGKSTLADLLLGLVAPDDGEILADGVPLARYSRASLRRRIGYVTQDPELFHVPVRDNIALARPDASEAEIVAAARAAHADGFIRALPQGYDTPVGDRGAHLSGGQRQRIALARAILLRPDVYVFDEATSMLDTESERLVQESIGALAETATVVVIAHRLSTIRRADAIYRLAEDGRAWPARYEELAARGAGG